MTNFIIIWDFKLKINSPTFVFIFIYIRICVIHETPYEEYNLFLFHIAAHKNRCFLLRACF